MCVGASLLRCEVRTYEINNTAKDVSFAKGSKANEAVRCTALPGHLICKLWPQSAKTTPHKQNPAQVGCLASLGTLNARRCELRNLFTV